MPSYRRLVVLPALALAVGTAACDNLTSEPETPSVPDIAVSVSEVVLTDSETIATVTLTPDGPGTVTWQIVGMPEWLTAEPRKATIEDGEPDEIRLTADAGGLPAAVHTADLRVQYTGDRSRDLPLRFVVGETPLMDVTVGAITLGHFETSRVFSVENLGNAPFTVTLGSSASHLEVTPATAVVPFRGSVDITVSAVRDGLDTGDHSAEVTVDADFGGRTTVAVVLRHYREPFTRLAHTVVDAEYDAVNDRVVTVSGDPGRLHVLDPVDGSDVSVALPGRPECVAVSQDGSTAVVGHNGLVSVVDLDSAELVATHSVSTDAHDIVLGPGGWAYVFPASGQGDTVRCLDLATGEESPHTGPSVSGNMTARLHPSGNSIYAADTGLSPSDLHRLDIGGGVAEYLYDSPYHGDFPVEGDLWFLEDGTRALTASGNVFSVTGVQEDDLEYRGALDGTDRLVWADHSALAGRIVAIPGDDGPDPEGVSELRFYEPGFLLLQGSLSLWDFKQAEGVSGGSFHASEGRFAWIDASGTRVHVLVESPQTSTWAVGSYDIGQVP